MKNLTRFFLFLLAAVCASTQAFAGGCPGGERDYLPPCCDSYTVPGAGGVCTAPSTHYLFTVNQFGFENQAGDITWFGTPAQFDANSSTVGQAVGNFVSQATLPTDTYVAFRANIVNNIQLYGGCTPLRRNGQCSI